MEEVNLQPVTFPPQVLSAIAPDISLERHLSLGLRPSLRGFEEFQNIQFEAGDELSRGSNNVESPILGASVLKCGATSVVCTINGGIIETELEESSLFTTVFPVVEVVRGKINGPPTDEEMIVSQQLQDTILTSRIIPAKSLEINVGFKTPDGDIIFNNDEEADSADSVLAELTNRKRYSFVLYASIQVFSRSGPVFDICYGSLIAALQKINLPLIYIDENVSDLRVNSKNRTTIIQENHKLLCHATKTRPLRIHQENLNWSVTFGVASFEGKNILLLDIEGDAEETCTKTRINVVIDKKLKLKSLNIINGGDSTVQKEDISKAIGLAKKRVSHLLG